MKQSSRLEKVVLLKLAALGNRLQGLKRDTDSQIHSTKTDVTRCG